MLHGGILQIFHQMLIKTGPISFCLLSNLVPLGLLILLCDFSVVLGRRHDLHRLKDFGEIDIDAAYSRCVDTGIEVPVGRSVNRNVTY